MAGRESMNTSRAAVGLLVWCIATLSGLALNVWFFWGAMSHTKNPARMEGAMAMGCAFAFAPLFAYMFVPILLDRFDPEPWWCLLLAFVWGATFATGVSAWVNTAVDAIASAVFDRDVGKVVASSVSAPIIEELTKGLMILGLFVFVRREFDGVMDGIIYAIFCALGFAAVENILYYGKSAAMGTQVLASTFVLRGVLTPWIHPLFTSMTGIGVGLAREASGRAVRVLGPLAGYGMSVALHAAWNTLPLATRGHRDLFAAWLGLWLLFVAAFLGLIVPLVIRKGRIIRKYLQDEVLFGSLSPQDVDLVCSPVGRIRSALSGRGALGKRLIQVAARLALCKWHAARANKGRRRTVSVEVIAPLRQELLAVRSVMSARDVRT